MFSPPCGHLPRKAARCSSSLTRSVSPPMSVPRMVFMDGGRIVEQGPPKELIANPTTERAQRFLSSIRH